MKQYLVPLDGLDLELDGQSLRMAPKRFKSGSVGWYLSQKLEVMGERVQLSFSCVVVGSKPPADLIEVSHSDDAATLEKKAQEALKSLPRSKRGKTPSEGTGTSQNGVKATETPS